LASDKPVVTVKVKRRIVKYAEGDTPGVDEPFEIDEKEEVVVGEEAEQVLKELGVK